MSLLRKLRDRPTLHPLSWLGRDLSVAFLGHFSSRSLGIVTFIVMTRTLEPARYGLFLLAYSVLEIAQYMTDLGLDVGTTRFVARAEQDGRRDVGLAVLRAVFLTKLFLAALLVAVLWVASPIIAERILARPEAAPYIRIAAIGVFGNQLGGFWQAYFGSRLQFLRNAAFSTIAPAGILVIVVGLRLRGMLDVATCLHVYVWVPLVVCAGATFALGPRFLRATGPVLPPLRSVWRFSRWVYLSNALSVVRFRLNGILLARLATLQDVGLYGYGDKLASVLTLFTSAITTVFVPRASRLLTKDELRALLRMSYRWMLMLTPLFVLGPFAVRPVIAFLSPEYVEASRICVILSVSIVFSLASLPSNTVLYSMNQPYVETFIEVIALALTAVLGVTLVRSHGGVGAAVAMLVQRFVSATLMIGWVYIAVFRRGALNRGAPE